MKRKIIRFLLWFSGILMLLLVVFTTVLYLNQDKIKAAIFTEVNQLLTEPVSIQSVDVSLRKFPYASLAINEVFSAGANAQPGDTLIYARQVFLEFNLWNVFSDDISIRKISLETGTLHILRPSRGTPNYQIWQQDSTSGNSLFTLDEVSFENFRLFQYEEGVSQMASGYVNELTFSGSFESDNFSISNSGKLFIDSLVVDKTVYLKKAHAKTSFTLTGSTNQFQFTEGVLQLNDTEVDFAINIEPKGVAILAGKKGLKLDDFQELAATQNWGIPKNINASGKANISFKGVFEDDKEPDVELEFVTSGTTLSGYNNASIKNFSCQGAYLLKKGKDNLQLKNFKGDGRSGSFAGSLSIKDFSQPDVVLDLKSDLEFSEWLIFLPADTLTKPEGRANIDVHFENRFKSLSSIKPEELKRAKASGTIMLEGIGFTFKNSDRRVEDLDADLRFLGNDLKIAHFFFRTGQSDIYLQGAFENVLNYAYFNDQKLNIDAQMRSQQLMMEDFILGGTSDSEAEYNLEFVKALDLELNLAVDKFSFENFYATDIRGQLYAKNGLIEAKSIKLNADEGTFEGQLSVDTRPSNYKLQSSLKAASVNINKLFLSFGNFGQQEITSKNLFGIANLSMQLSCTMSPTLDIDLASIVMESDLAIENGRLTNYEPMLVLSRFADIKELQDVRFSKLQNNISIKNSQVIIPMMNINSNVMDLGLQGIHGFDNVIDYSIRLKLSDVLFSNRKNKPRKSEFDDHLVEVEKDDDPNIYIRMAGPIENPTIELDRKGMSQSINEGFKEQGRQLKDIFKKKDPQEKKKENSGIKFDLFGDEKGD
jgi:hypothetical protein